MDIQFLVPIGLSLVHKLMGFQLSEQNSKQPHGSGCSLFPIAPC